MRTTRARLAALLLAMMFALGLTPALAQEAPPVTLPMGQNLMQEFMASGQSMQVDFGIQLSPMLGNMISSLTAQGGSDNDSLTAINSLLNAVNKIKTTLVFNQASVSGVVGTDLAALLDFQVAMNMETKENHITSSLLPGIALSVDPAAIPGADVFSAQMTPAKMQELAAPYLAAFQEYANGISQTMQVEEGEYLMGEYGTYTHRTELNVTTHMVADFFEKLGKLFQEDKNLKAFLAEAAKANQALELEDATPTAAEDPAKGLLDTAAKLKAEEDKLVMTGNFYQDGQGKVYMDLVTAEDFPQTLKIDAVLTAQNTDAAPGPFTLNARILTAAKQPAAEGETPVVLNFATLESDIKEGRNLNDTLIQLNLALQPELPQVSSEGSIGIVTGGMNVGLSYSDTANVSTMESNGKIALSFMTPEPMVTFTFAAKPAAVGPVAPLLDDKQVVVIKEGETGEEINQLMEQALSQALPQLMERLQAALPEEAPIILNLLMSPSGEEATEETVVVEEVPAETEETTEEVVEETTEVVEEETSDVSGEEIPATTEEETPVAP